MLETALATTYEPASNMRDVAVGANWTFVLPSLAVERLLCLGAPSEPTLTTLARFARSVIVWCPDPRRRRRLAAFVQARGWAHVDVEAELPDSRPRREDGFDLVCLSTDSARSLSTGGDGLRRVPALLHPDGRLYLEWSDRAARKAGRVLLAELARSGYLDSRRLWLTPRRGEVRAAVPAAFPDVSAYLVHHGLHRPAAPVGLLDRATRLLLREHARTHPTHRTGIVVGAGSEAGPWRVPRFVAAVASEAGVDLDGYRWGLSARGRYSSRKAVFILFREPGTAPDHVVKLTRDPRLNPRLENEHRALAQLGRDRAMADGTYPEVTFFGYHGGLAILGQKALEGAAFEARSIASDGCPHGRAAARWLADLAAATAERPAGSDGAGITEALGRLLESYQRLYAPDPDEHAFLADQVAALGTAPIPAVFQHGDPGTWNLLVTPAGQVAFLDWEAADPHGMPLWDLFHFFRSYGQLASRRQGIRDPLDGFARQFLAHTPVSRLLAESVEAYVDRLRLPGDLAGPLLLTGWMHRALKEATRLRPHRLAEGHYVRLLRLTISHWHNPALRRSLSVPR